MVPSTVYESGVCHEDYNKEPAGQIRSEYTWFSLEEILQFLTQNGLIWGAEQQKII